MVIQNQFEILFKQLTEELPRFPDGRADYSKSKKAIVLTAYLRFRNEILLLKRSTNVSTYPGYWNTVAGYLDEKKPLLKKIYEEINEETKISPDQIEEITIYEPVEIHDENINRIWITFPALVTLREKPKVELDWEHTEYKWINPLELNNYKTVPELTKNYWNITREKGEVKSRALPPSGVKQH